MKAEFWLQRWQQNQIGFHQREVNTNLQEFWGSMELPRGSLVFVPMCGKSRDLLWLREQDFSVLGVEISQIAVQSFHAENRLYPKIAPRGGFECWDSDRLRILRGDVFALKAEDVTNVAGVYDRASLIALPPNMRADYTGHLLAILPTTAKILLVTLEYLQEEMQGPPFSVREEEVRGLYGDRYEIKRLSDKDVLNANPRFRDQGLTQLCGKVYYLRYRRQLTPPNRT